MLAAVVVRADHLVRAKVVPVVAAERRKVFRAERQRWLERQTEVVVAAVAVEHLGHS